jgi:hypothetical protein
MSAADEAEMQRDLFSLSTGARRPSKEQWMAKRAAERAAGTEETGIEEADPQSFFPNFWRVLDEQQEQNAAKRRRQARQQGAAKPGAGDGR